MAVAKLVCGDCGGSLAPSDVRCPSCGASIEKEVAPLQQTACRACGQRNAPGSEFCLSCGARLADGRAEQRGKPRRSDGPPRKPGVRPATSVGVWQIISGAAVLALLAYLAYMQIWGANPPAPVIGTAQENPPLSGIGMNAVDLKPLEDAVRTRPSDAGAQLMLANALHDNRMLARAVDAYRKYLTLRPGDADARTDLGICFFQQAQADSVNRESLLHEAAAAMKEAFNSAPRPHQPSAFNLGVVYLHLSDLEESNRWFKKAVEINRDSDLGKRAQNLITQHAVPQ